MGPCQSLDGCLRRLDEVKGGYHVGEICCAAPTCADGVAAISNMLGALQSMVSSAVDYSEMELYIIQPGKSVILPVNSNFRNCQTGDIAINIGSKPLPNVSESMHMGILWSANSQESAVQENIKKARRTIHRLLGTGLHGENGLDPDTSIHLLQTYVVPVLVYGLEVILPNDIHLDKLERLHKRFLNQIFCQKLTQYGWMIEVYINAKK